MSLRFRRTVKLMPGVRLNFSPSGISTSIGVRGAGLTFSSRSTTTHYGIPGTGLSYRTTSSAGGGRTQLDRWRRQHEREQERQLATEQLGAYERELSHLREILRSRVLEPVDWAAEYASHGPFQPEPFEPPFAEPSLESALAAVKEANPVFVWLVRIAAFFFAAALAPDLWLRVLLLLAGAFFSGRLIQMLRRRRAAAAELLPKQLTGYSESLEAARKSHHEEQVVAQQAYLEAEAHRAACRAIEQSEDEELASSILEVELSNEDIPVPVVFTVHFDGVRHVELDIDLPPLDLVPDQNLKITKTGKLSERPMAARARSALYCDICAGLALRLIYETFRVLPFVDAVVARGLAERPVHPAGEPRYRALDVSASRDPFSRYDLDTAAPSAILAALGGQLSAARDGSLKPLKT